MKILIIITLFFGLFFPLYSFSISNDENANSRKVKNNNKITSNKEGKGTWLWRTSSIISTDKNITANDKKNIKKLIKFCKQKGIIDIYLQLNIKIPTKKYKCLISKLNKSFVKVKSGNHPIKVWLLDGNVNWANSNSDGSEKVFFDWIINYQKKSSKSQKFVGVHLDVEPYGDPLWKDDYDKSVLNYQNFVLKSMEIVKNANKDYGTGLEITFDIPFWFDEKYYNNSFGHGNLAEWMYKNTPSLAIMSYRDSFDGMRDVVKNELKYSKIYNKKTIISAETSFQRDVPQISFYEEGENHMNKVFSLIESNISKDNLTSGVKYSFSVHDFSNWKLLKP